MVTSVDFDPQSAKQKSHGNFLPWFLIAVFVNVVNEMVNED